MPMFLLSLLLATIGNADIVKLVKAGLSAETIEAKIAASDADFDTSTEALVALADAGVPDPPRPPPRRNGWSSTSAALRPRSRSPNAGQNNLDILAVPKPLDSDSTPR